MLEDKHETSMRDMKSKKGKLEESKEANTATEVKIR